MKTYLIIIILFLFSNVTIGQKYFETTLKQSSTSTHYVLTPLFEHEVYDKTGKTDAVYFFKESSYLKNLLNKSLESVLSKDSINKLEKTNTGRSRSFALIIVDHTGKTREITFYIIQNDREILTDQVMYKFYQKIMEVQIDMNKVEINTSKIMPKEQTYSRMMFGMYWFNTENSKTK